MARRTVTRRRAAIVAALVASGGVAAVLLIELLLALPTWFDPGAASHFERSAARRELDYAAHPFLPYVGNPGRNFDIHWTDPEGRRTYLVNVQMNSSGFRAHEFPERKGPDDLVVLCLGGSTVWGAVAPTNADTWPELLEARLAAAHPSRNVRVYNLGLSGASTAMNVVVLATIAIHLQPDLVIAYEGFNDVGPVDTPDFRFDHSHYFIDFDPETAWLGFHNALPPTLRRSHVALRVANALDTILGVNSLMRIVTRPPDPARRARLEDTVDRVFANLRTMHSIATGHGSRALFATFQFFAPKDYPFALNDGLRRGFAAHGMDYVDIDAIIPDGDRTLQVDECHFTDRGRELVADAFFRHIEAHRLLGEAR